MNIIEKGTYKFIDNPGFLMDPSGNTSVILTFNFKSKELNFKGIKFTNDKKVKYILSNNSEVLVYYMFNYSGGNKVVWEDEEYKTIKILESIDLQTNTELYQYIYNGTTKIKDTKKNLKVNGKVFSKVNNKYLKNLNDSPIFAAKKAEVVSAGETWLINENPDITVETFLNTTITGKLNPLTANNTYGDPVKMYMIGVQQNNAFVVGINAQGYGGIMYGLPLDSSDTSGNKTWKFITENMDIYTVEDTVKLRTVTFDTAPTGELLTWLQANAVKQ